MAEMNTTCDYGMVKSSKASKKGSGGEYVTEQQCPVVFGTHAFGSVSGLSLSHCVC